MSNNPVLTSTKREGSEKKTNVHANTHTTQCHAYNSNLLHKCVDQSTGDNLRRKWPAHPDTHTYTHIHTFTHTHNTHSTDHTHADTQTPPPTHTHTHNTVRRSLMYVQSATVPHPGTLLLTQREGVFTRAGWHHKFDAGVKILAPRHLCENPQRRIQHETRRFVRHGS